MPDWSTRLEELATATAVPGAVLGIWADGEQLVAPYGVRLGLPGRNWLPRASCPWMTYSYWDASLQARLIEPLGLEHTMTLRA